MFLVTKEIVFDAAHRLMGYEGPCANIHGHTYKAKIIMGAMYLTRVGFVIDFADVKKIAKVWIDENWDHATLLSSEDPLIEPLKKDNAKLYLFDKKNPSAEVMAEELYHLISGKLAGHHVVVKAVSIDETPTSSALYTPYSG